MKTKIRIDLWLLVPVAVLIAISLVTLLSLDPAFFWNQLFTLSIALVAFFVFSQLNIESVRQLKVPMYIGSLILLSIVLVIGIESRGAIRWIDIFGVRIQFSEVLKPFLALVFAAYISEKKTPTVSSFFKIIIFLLPVLLLIFLQPDLGSALLYAFVALFALIVIGFPWRWFALSFIPVALLSPFVWLVLHDYQRQRIMTFLHPKSDPLGSSYNSIQAMIAVGSGTFWGKGLSEGTQSALRFLPERHTDFIFATLAEGLGFIGAAIVIIALLVLCYRIFAIFNDSKDLFNKVFAACACGFILIQGFVNIGMNIGILPIVGITLPFVSFGGSSLLSNFIFLGILSSISRSARNREVLEIR
jgi:rod shape determining protein RodA